MMANVRHGHPVLVKVSLESRPVIKYTPCAYMCVCVCGNSLTLNKVGIGFNFPHNLAFVRAIHTAILIVQKVL